MKIYTRKAIAQILGLSEKRVKQLTEEGVVDEYSHGHYKLLPVLQGYLNYLRSQIADDDSTSDYNTEKAKLTKIKREDAELEIQLKRNELHRAADVEFVLTNMLIAFKAKLTTLPNKVLPSILNIPTDENKPDYLLKILRTAVDEALLELSDYGPNLFSENNYLLDGEVD